MEINTANLLRSIELMKGIPEERIDMEAYRKGGAKDTFTHVCKSNGCVIGFSTQLDTMENLSEFITSEWGEEEFSYTEWSEVFFGLESSSMEWAFMFAGYWPNNKTQIIKRMQWIADDNKIPPAFIDELNKKEGGSILDFTLP